MKCILNGMALGILFYFLITCVNRELFFNTPYKSIVYPDTVDPCGGSLYCFQQNVENPCNNVQCTTQQCDLQPLESISEPRFSSIINDSRKVTEEYFDTYWDPPVDKLNMAYFQYVEHCTCSTVESCRRNQSAWLPDFYIPRYYLHVAHDIYHNYGFIGEYYENADFLSNDGNSYV